MSNKETTPKLVANNQEQEQDEAEPKLAPDLDPPKQARVINSTIIYSEPEAAVKNTYQGNGKAISLGDGCRVSIYEEKEVSKDNWWYRVSRETFTQSWWVSADDIEIDSNSGS